MISEEEILKAKVLIVDDQEISVRLLEEILRKAGYQNITCVCDSREAAETYRELKPDAFVLDLHMPYLDGFQVMTQLRETQGSDYLPILVLTQLENRDLRYLALESGAKDFLNKPYDRVEVLVRIRNIIEVHMLHRRLGDQKKTLEEDVRQRTRELRRVQLDMIQHLARVAEYRDKATGMHIIRMSHYSACLAAKVGFSKEECEMILVAIALHDIGKVAIPDSILLKPERLTPEEREVMRTHAAIGAELLSGSESKVMQMAKEIALTHHERWDGSGYPRSLKGGQIPLLGRICCLCDIFDALINERPYKKAMAFDKAVEEIRADNGKSFDPDLVKNFLEILPEIRQIVRKYENARFEDIV